MRSYKNKLPKLMTALTTLCHFMAISYAKAELNWHKYRPQAVRKSLEIDQLLTLTHEKTMRRFIPILKEENLCAKFL